MNQKNYSVLITEALSKTVQVMAANEDEALKEVRKRYKAEELVLDADDFAGVEFRVMQKDIQEEIL